MDKKEIDIDQCFKSYREKLDWWESIVAHPLAFLPEDLIFPSWSWCSRVQRLGRFFFLIKFSKLCSTAFQKNFFFSLMLTN